MPYIPLHYTKLSVNTKSLKEEFDKKLKRYTLIESQDISQNALQVLIARTHDVIECKTGRVGPQDAIAQLVRELKNFIDDNGEKNQHAAFFLLGALLHRYYRIKGEWLTSSGELLKSISNALRLEKTKEYEQKKLDPVTVYSALKVFQNNMLKLNEEHIPRYKNYEHFADKGTHFVSNLKIIVETHYERARPYLLQYNAIFFLQSVVTHLNNNLVRIESGLKELKLLLQNDYSDSMELNITDIKSFIDNLPSSCPKEILNALLGSKYVFDKVQNKTIPDYLYWMKQCQLQLATWDLFGAYMLITSNLDSDSKLCGCLLTALSLELGWDDICYDTRLNGINCFKKYLKENKETQLNYDFFGGEEEMKKMLEITEERIKKHMKQTQTVEMSPSIKF